MKKLHYIVINIFLFASVCIAQSGSYTVSDGTKIPHIDDQNYGQDKTYRFDFNYNNIRTIELSLPDESSSFAVTGIEYTVNGTRKIIHVGHPTLSLSGYEEYLKDGNGNICVQNDQHEKGDAYPTYPPPCEWGDHMWKMDQFDLHWGDILVWGYAANGQRGIIKSTHELMGIKSYSYKLEHVSHGYNFNQWKTHPDRPWGYPVDSKGNIPAGGRGDDNYLNYYSDEGGAERIIFDFQRQVSNVSVIVAQRNNYNVSMNWIINGDDTPAPDPTFLMDVINGTGDGVYTEGTVVSIAANDPEVEMEFDRWQGDAAYITDIYAAVTTFTMPAANASIEALYKPIEPCTDCGGEFYRYLKFETTSIDGDRIRLSEIEYVANSTTYPLQKMTGENSPAPLIVTSSHEGWQNPWKLYDGMGTVEAFNIGTTTYWNIIDLGAGNDIAPTEIVITHGSKSGKNPVDFTVSGSNDMFLWDVLLTVTGEPQWNAWSVHNFSMNQKSGTLNLSNSDLQQISIYPNPVSDGIIYINSGNRFDELITIQLIDKSGRVVFSERVNLNDSERIELKHLPKGVYFMHFKGLNWIETHKIILN